VRLPPPYYEGPPVPIYNATHDVLVAQWRAEKLRKAQEELEAAIAQRKQHEEERAKRAAEARASAPVA
jgi:hypothetical protein